MSNSCDMTSQLKVQIHWYWFTDNLKSNLSLQYTIKSFVPIQFLLNSWYDFFDCQYWGKIKVYFWCIPLRESLFVYSMYWKYDFVFVFLGYFFSTFSVYFFSVSPVPSDTSHCAFDFHSRTWRYWTANRMMTLMRLYIYM